MSDLDDMGIGQGGLGGYLLGLLGNQAPSQGMGAALLGGAPSEAGTRSHRRRSPMPLC